MSVTAQTEVLVLGGGPAGLIAACLLAGSGVHTVLIAPETPPDTRTTALMHNSLETLTRIGAWPRLAPSTGVLRKLRLIDSTASLVRAPETVFDAAELRLSAFGNNIPNTELLRVLRELAAGLPLLSILTSPATAVRPGATSVEVALENGDAVEARLVVGADGRRSICREAAGIHAKEWDYPQSALTLNFSHTRPHDSVSTEFHRRSGPMVVVPLPGNRSSVVLVDTPERIELLHKLDTHALGRELERLTQGILGGITPDDVRGIRPLGGLSVDRFGANRIALVGESAHILPPIGAQGLNLGIRDAVEIARLASEALAGGRDPGRPELLAAYDKTRHQDARPRQVAVDLLNRSLFQDFLPFDAGRAFGLWALSSLAPLRREVMRRGVVLASNG